MYKLNFFAATGKISLMKHEAHAPETPATQFLREHRIAHSNHLYEYEEHGGTSVSARELNVDEHAVVKTLVMEDETGKPLIVLMHGGRRGFLVGVQPHEIMRVMQPKAVECGLAD